MSVYLRFDNDKEADEFIQFLTLERAMIESGLMRDSKGEVDEPIDSPRNVRLNKLDTWLAKLGVGRLRERRISAPQLVFEFLESRIA